MSKRRFYKVVIIGVLCIIGVLLAGYAVWTRYPAEEPVPRGLHTPKTPYTACYHEVNDISADTAYLLVDLSDATDWPHTATNEVILKSVAMRGMVSGAHHWNLTVGVVVENDATDGTAVWVTNEHLITVTGVFAPPQRTFAAGGLNLRAASSALTYGVANGHSELTAWQNDTAISATVGTTGTVAVGDLVILADEITDGSTLDFSICVDYDTE